MFYTTQKQSISPVCLCEHTADRLGIRGEKHSFASLTCEIYQK